MGGLFRCKTSDDPRIGVTPRGIGMRHREAREVIPATTADGGLSSDELSTVLSALWVWRGQLGRVGSKQPIPGLATAEARKRVDEIARKLGGNPNMDFFGAVPISALQKPAERSQSVGQEHGHATS